MNSIRTIALVLLFLWTSQCMTNSKLSIHTSMGSNSWKIVQSGQPRVIKLLDTFGPASDIKKDVPGIVIVGRIYLSNQPTNDDPTQAAQNWWNQVGNTILQYPDVDYWEGYNEPDVGSLSAIQWYTQFEIARIKILSTNQRKASIGNFAVGTPDVNNAQVIQAFYPAIDAALQAQGILGVHEYAAPFLNSTFSGSSRNGTGWLTGRYRKLYEQYLLPTHRKIPLVISENGIDGGTCAVTGCHIGGGWKDFCGYWQQNGLGSDCNQAYMNQLQWYDEVMRSNNYVIGSTIFCLEISGWDDFDIGPLTDIFIKYLQSQ